MKKYLFFAIFLFILVFGVGCEDQHKEDKVYVTFSTNIDLDITTLELQKNSLLSHSNLPNIEIENKIFVGWFLDINYENNFQDIEILEDMILYGLYEDYATRQENYILNNIKIPATTYVNIDLPTKISSFDISWDSTHPSILSNGGIYGNVHSNTFVTLTAYIVSNNAVFDKSFTIEVLPFPYDLEAKNISDSIIFPNEIKSDISLITVFNHNFIGTWVSNKPDVVSNDGKVTRGEVDEVVTIELTLIKDDFLVIYSYEFLIKAYELDVNNPQYFINSLEDKDINTNNIIMDYEEIKAYNQVVLNSNGANVVSLEDLDQTVTKSYVSSLILKYSNIDRYSIYDNGRIGTYLDKQNILNNCNLDGLNQTINIQYGVSVKHTSLRSYPTDFYSGSVAIDRFQETGFSAGVPMIIYHKSLDSNWYYVRMYHYDGWVKAEDIAVSSREDFLKYNKTGNFIVVLDNIIEVNSQIIRMGYTLPYSSRTESGFELDFPTRKNDGTLEIKKVMYPNDGSVNDGFIEYNYRNLLVQGYKLLGMQYSWGDKIVDGLDCSSTQAAIYNCFGFILGRNTSNQWKTSNYGNPISSLTNESLKNYEIGTLLYTPSHVLMYIGVDKDGNCWLLHNTSTGNICKLQTLNSYGTSSINNMLVFHN